LRARVFFSDQIQRFTSLMLIFLQFEGIVEISDNMCLNSDLSCELNIRVKDFVQNWCLRVLLVLVYIVRTANSVNSLWCF